jgi:Zn-dependent protease
VLAITVRPVAQEWMWSRLQRMPGGRHLKVDWNPLRFVDPVGTLAVPFIMFVFSQVAGAGMGLIGWAKPPRQPWGVRNPREALRTVALAALGSNFAMTVAWALLLRLALLVEAGGAVSLPEALLHQMASYGMEINAFLLAFYLLPIPPLDGGRIVASLLPRHLANQFEQLEAYGMNIVLVLAIVPGSPLGVVLRPIASFVLRIASLLVGL